MKNTHAVLICILAFAVLILALRNLAHARPARPREVKVTITLREQVAVRAWLQGDPEHKIPPISGTNSEEIRSLVAVYDDLRLGDGRAWVEGWVAKHKKDRPPVGLSLEDIPETKVAVSLDQGEAKDLVKWLAPTETHPQDAALGRVLLGFSDALEDALAARPAK